MNLLESFKRSLWAEKKTIRNLKNSNHDEQKKIIVGCDRQSLSTIYSMCKKTIRAQNCRITESQSNTLFDNQQLLKDNFLSGHVRKKNKNELSNALLSVSKVQNGLLLATILKCFN